MSETGMERFLRALFIRETSGRTKIVNEFGYAGKYQFGEAALEDLGYFKGDGKPNSRDGKFLYDGAAFGQGRTGLPAWRRSLIVKRCKTRPLKNGCCCSVETESTMAPKNFTGRQSLESRSLSLA